MMLRDDYLGFYWGSRKENVGQCARRTSHLIQLLAKVSRPFSDWAIARGEWNVAVSSTKSIEQAFCSVSDDRCVDDPGSYDTLGLMLTLTTGVTEESAFILRVRCGCYGHAHLGNALVLDPPMRGKLRNEFLRLTVLRSVIEAIVVTFDPDFGVATSHQLAEEVEMDDFPISVGWLTYVAHGFASVASVQDLVSIEEIGGRGRLLIVSDAPIAISDRDRVELVRKVAEEINENVG